MSRVYPQWFIDEVVDKGNLYEHKSDEKIEFICSKHGVYRQRIADHWKASTGERRKGCPKCAQEIRVQKSKEELESRRHVYPQWFIDELVDEEDIQRAKHGKLFGYDQLVRFNCPEHGIYSQRAGDHLRMSTMKQGTKCPVCSRIDQNRTWIANGMRSGVEIEIDKYVSELGLVTSHESRFLDGKYEIDIYISSLKKGIEVDGLGHIEIPKEEYYMLRSKGDKFCRRYKPEGYHEHKDQLALQQGISLLHVTDDEWVSNREETEQKIRRFLYGN